MTKLVSPCYTIGMELLKVSDKTSSKVMIGIAGELRVASELLMRGIGCSRPFVDNYGVDLITDGGVRIQVKTSMLTSTLGYYKDGKPHKRSPSYSFCLARGSECEFYVIWLPEPDSFYIFPFDAVKANDYRQTFRIYRESGKKNTLFSTYEGSWDLIEEANEVGRKYKYKKIRFRMLGQRDLFFPSDDLPKRPKRKRKSKTNVNVAEDKGIVPS